MTNKDKAVAVLQSIETGDTKALAYINPNKYIQHNLAIPDGVEGIGGVLQNAPTGGFKVKVIRAFQDGDYVFTHTKYDFFGPKIGFDIFRFEEGLIVEHWDNLIETAPANPSGRTQTDGNTQIRDENKTMQNKALVQEMIENLLLKGQHNFTDYINPTQYLQHNPAVADGLEGFGAAMQSMAANGLVMEYSKIHKVLGEGNFVLIVSEGKFGKGEPTSFYDLFRVEDGKIVEHWDVIEPIAPEETWKNNNGKFNF